MHGAGDDAKLCQPQVRVLGLGQTSLRIPLKLLAAGEPRVFLVSDGGNWPLSIRDPGTLHSP